LRAADLHPEPLVPHQVEQLLEAGLVEAERRVDAPHVVDHDRHGGTLERGHELADQRALEMDLEMPAERRQPVAERDDVLDRRALAQVLHEVEADAAESEGVETAEL